MGLRWIVWMWLSLSLLACGDDGGGGGAAGMAATPGLGEPCTSSCEPGFVCGRAGPFLGVCSADCNNDAACGLLVPGSICVGGVYNKCAINCGNGAACPPGTACVELANRMTCTATGAMQQQQQQQ